MVPGFIKDSHGLQQKAFVYGECSRGLERRRVGGEMLTIRQSQIEIFSAVEVRRFEDWMVSHLRRFFPLQCAALAEAELRESIQRGIVRAARYGIRTKRDVCKFIDVMIVLGEDFDSAEAPDWARKILSRPGDSGMKIKTLLLVAKRRLAKK